MSKDKIRGIVVWQALLILLVLTLLAVMLFVQSGKVSRRSQQSEIKRNLIEIVGLLADYHIKHGSYVTDLRLLGWIPQGSPGYIYGFSIPYYPPEVSRGPDYLSYTGYVEVEEDLRGVWDHSREMTYNGMYLNQLDLIGEFGDAKLIPQASRDRFLLAAVGNLDSDRALDVWCIDDQWNLKHVFDDLNDEFLGMPSLDGLVQDLEELKKDPKTAHRSANKGKLP